MRNERDGTCIRGCPIEFRIGVLAFATVTHRLSMYRFVFQTASFGTRAFIIKRVTRFNRFRGFETSDCVRRRGWVLLRWCDVHEGFDYMAKIFRAMHSLGAFNMLLLFAFRFCYARIRAHCALHSANIVVMFERENIFLRTSSSRCW